MELDVPSIYIGVYGQYRIMPTEARGNYLPEPPYLRETKTYHSQPLESTRHDTTCWQLFRPAISTAHFYFFVAEVMSNDLTGWKFFSLLPEAPLRPEARGNCHICHTVNPALYTASRAWSSASCGSIFNSWYLLQRGLRTHTVYQGWKKSWLQKIFKKSNFFQSHFLLNRIVKIYFCASRWYKGTTMRWCDKWQGSGRI